MFITYLRRELRRRRRTAAVIAAGLALGIALVIAVSSASAGMRQAQDEVLESLYGLGTDMTVTRTPAVPGEDGGDSGDGGRPERPRFEFGPPEDGGDTEAGDERVMVQGFRTLQADAVEEIGGLSGVAGATGALELTVIAVDGEFRFRMPGGSPGGTPQQADPQTGQTGQSEQTEEDDGSGASFSVDSYTVMGLDVTASGLGPLTTSGITEGQGFTAAQTEAAVAVVDAGYARENELAPGDTLTVSGTGFTVTGIATAESAEAAADVYVPLGQAQELADREDEVTAVYVRAGDSQQIDAVKAAVEESVADATVTTSSDLAETVSGSLSTASGLAGSVGRWLSVSVLAAAFLVSGLLTSSAVSRRVREFGTLKALGWSQGRVTRQVVGEALVTGLAGGAAGIGLGLAAAYAFTALSPTLTAELGSAGAAAFPASPGGAGGGFPGGPGAGPGSPLGEAASATVEIALSAPVTAGTLAPAAGLAIVGGLIAGAFGGWRAARLRPADALRRVA